MCAHCSQGRDTGQGLDTAAPAIMAARDARAGIGVATPPAFCGGVGHDLRVNSRPTIQRRPPQQWQLQTSCGSTGTPLGRIASSSGTALLSTAAMVGGAVMAIRSFCFSAHASASSSTRRARASRVAVGAKPPVSAKLRQEEDRLIRNMEDIMEKEGGGEVDTPPVLETVKTKVPRFKDVRQVLPRAIPFLPEPGYRAFAANVSGDAGFDPLNLCSDVTKFVDYREAELKHGRLAMLVAVAWPVAELSDQAAAEAGLPDILAASGGRVLTQLTGGVEDQFVEGFLALVILVGSIFELIGRPDDAAPGDVGFDPLKLRTWNPGEMSGLLPAQRVWMEEAELKHGRFAMSVVLYDILDELLTGNPVVDDTEFLFHRIDAKLLEPDYWGLQADILDAEVDGMLDVGAAVNLLS